MKKIIVMTVYIFLCSCLFSQNTNDTEINIFQQRSPIDLLFNWGFVSPYGDDAIPGTGGMFTGRFNIPPSYMLNIPVEFRYSWLPMQGNTSHSMISLGTGIGRTVGISPRLDLSSSVIVGYYVELINESLVNTESIVGSHLNIAPHIGFSYKMTPSFSLGLDLSYTYRPDLPELLSVSLGWIYNLSSSRQNPVVILDTEIEDLFPAMFQYYQDVPSGFFRIENRAKHPVSNLQVTIFVRDYMNHPMVLDSPSTLISGEQKKLDLKFLFNDRVLGILEGMQISGELTLEYDFKDRHYINKQPIDLYLHDRNAITWDDDRKAALFISQKDPDVLAFAGRTAAVLRDSQYRPVNVNFRMAAGIHAALSNYGISYVVDPRSPYCEEVLDGLTLDFLKFPFQTLRYQAGDCDDLSVLYCSLLESAGIETALITVPGHIFAAVSLGILPEQAEKIFTSKDDLIISTGKVWMPVETTSISNGFINAWRTGAKQWRDNVESGNAILYPNHESWKEYAPVALREREPEIEYPLEKDVGRLYENEMLRFLKQELEPKVQEYRRVIEERGGSIKAINRLGTLYARFGLYDLAEIEFRKILQTAEFLPAMTNLANIYFQQEKYQEALLLLEKAHSLDRNDPTVLLCMSMTCFELELYEETHNYYNNLKIANIELAGEYAYLAVRTKEETRASGFIHFSKEPIWMDE
jgi:tetratricopeptide (TPR) repeat protein